MCPHLKSHIDWCPSTGGLLLFQTGADSLEQSRAEAHLAAQAGFAILGATGPFLQVRVEIAPVVGFTTCK